MVIGMILCGFVDPTNTSGLIGGLWLGWRDESLIDH
jgi:hypothetical protein